eukprot:jgi/Ulvmu1/5549/UM023_0085.1
MLSSGVKASACAAKPITAARNPSSVPSRQRNVHAKAAQEVTGMVFQPFSEVQTELSTVTTAPITESYARVDYHPEVEAAVNEQINIEYTISYVYHALHSYFNRDNVGLPGFAKFFSEASDEEREHAQLLMDYQAKRGGRVELKQLAAPEMEFANDDKGDALYAMELALSLEKLNFHKLQILHAVADKHKDAAICDFVEGNLLQDQVDAVKEHAVYVSQLRRVGKGVGVYLFDQELAEAEAA